VRSGEVVRGRAKMRVDQLQTSGDWLVAGIKLEKDGGGQSMESVRNAPFNSTGQWEDLSFTMVCTQSGSYVYRCMVAGGSGGTSQADVYFDDVTLAPTGQAQTVTVEVAYRAHSGGSAVTSSAAIYLDALTLRGSTAGLAHPTNIMTALRTEARTIGTNASASIPAVEYPPLFSHGEPASGRFPGGIEAALVGWKFKYLTNNVALTCTNTLTVYELSTNGAGYIEFDQYVYCGKNPHKLRGQPLEIATNGPYFALGAKDGRSSEFGAGPFPADHTYVVGTPLSNFPRRLATGAAGGWPSTLRVVFPENFSTFSNALWNKHFVLHAVVTNGAATGVKALTVGLRASKTGATNDVDALTQELHLGWAAESATAGLVDYPNVTYQDHNEVALRAPWIYNLVDDGTGWYMQQSPRGSATIEPLDLFAVAQSNWVQRTYDETLFTWSHAASGVRSLFDDDQAYRLRGAVSYHVGLKVGHQYGTNDLGESNYPEVLNLRGNGYFRMADYDGVMAGSFRPMASDLFGLYKGKKNEDAPLMTKAYARVVPATSPTNDNSYGQVFASLRSKTNQFFIGIAQADLHFAPQEVAASGCYFDLQAETWAHKANIVTQHGPFSLFAQVSMHWRGGADINDGTEGHDVDCVMVKKADGEWVTHQILNPPTNVFHRTVAAFRSNDTVYLQQQDRGRDSYGFTTETPYKRASSFEITMLNDGGLPLDLDVYEENASSEINDNIDIACNVRSNLAAKQNLKYAYRYRTVYAPGVTVLSPGESGGGEGWSNDSFRIEFVATDGHDEPLVAELYYGNGRDADWRLINTNVVLYVPTNTHRLAYDWNTAGVATGAYYIKVAARRATGGKTGFDVSNTRLQVGRAIGLPRNAGVVSTVTTNTLEPGTNLSFEAGTAFRSRDRGLGRGGRPPRHRRDQHLRVPRHERRAVQRKLVRLELEQSEAGHRVPAGRGAARHRQGPHPGADPRGRGLGGGGDQAGGVRRQLRDGAVVQRNVRHEHLAERRLLPHRRDVHRAPDPVGRRERLPGCERVFRRLPGRQHQRRGDHQQRELRLLGRRDAGQRHRAQRVVPLGGRHERHRRRRGVGGRRVRRDEHRRADEPRRPAGLARAAHRDPVVRVRGRQQGADQGPRVHVEQPQRLARALGLAAARGAGPGARGPAGRPRGAVPLLSRAGHDQRDHDHELHRDGADEPDRAGRAGIRRNPLVVG